MAPIGAAGENFFWTPHFWEILDEIYPILQINRLNLNVELLNQTCPFLSLWMCWSLICFPFFPAVASLSSTSASSLNFLTAWEGREWQVVYNLNLNSRMTRISSTWRAHSHFCEWEMWVSTSRGRTRTLIYITREFKFELFTARAYESLINSNFETDVLESEATAGKKESRLVISISKLTKTDRFGLKVPHWGWDGLLVSSSILKFLQFWTNFSNSSNLNFFPI